ncbi:hypothetical protein KQI65_17020 [bacterium]|nr:hypothetical protein [bacterium]
MPAAIQQWPDDSLERQAYNAVENVPVVEANDRNRLGYHVFLYLKGELPSVEEAIHVAQPRMLIDKAEALRRITNALQAGESDGN